MAKAVYICTRNRLMGREDELRIRRSCSNLTPDILATSVTSRVWMRDRIAFGIVNDNDCVRQRGNSLLLGLLYEDASKWHSPATGSPDGSYAIFRSDPDYCEIVSDPAASRTVWYYLDDEQFVSSTSQRAIVNYLGSFVFDERVIPWMLSSGSLGPGYSWDRRIQRLGPDCSLLLDRNRWTFSVKQVATAFSEVPRTPSEHQELVTEAIRKTIKSMGIDILVTWALPLSGGYDSRALLCLISEIPGASSKLRTLTWGLREALGRESNDASIAKRLAQHFGTMHEYYPTDLSGEAIETLLQRFLVCGEGRVDHLAGYTDGFDLWRQLHDSGVAGIIRGDQAFGSKPASAPDAVRRKNGCGMCQDYSNLARLVTTQLTVSPQALPADLDLKEGESLQQWGNRLRFGYRIPTILAALTDLKSAFVEQCSPLLARRILTQVRQLPDYMTANKAMFRSIVTNVGPDIPYARDAATSSKASILREPQLVEYLRANIDTEYAKRILGPELIETIVSQMTTSAARRYTTGTSTTSSIVRMIVPSSLKSKWRRLGTVQSKPAVDANVLAFRVFMILRMFEMLNGDCKSEVPVTCRLSSGHSDLENGSVLKRWPFPDQSKG